MVLYANEHLNNIIQGDIRFYMKFARCTVRSTIRKDPIPTVH